MSIQKPVSFKTTNLSISDIMGTIIILILVLIAITITYIALTNKAIPESVETTPYISWEIDTKQKQMKVIKTPEKLQYAEQQPNLIFKHQNQEYYVQKNLSINTTMDQINQDTINSGDVLTGFTSGRWIIIWTPTDDVIGIVNM